MLLRAGAQRDRDHALSARRRGSLRARGGLRRLGRPARRSTGSTCATRRAWRCLPSTSCATLDRLDFIINNACQTVRRPAGFYAHLLRGRAALLRRACQHARAALARGLTSACAQRPTPLGCAQLTPRADRGRCAASGRPARTPAALSQLALLEEDLRARRAHLSRAGKLDADLQQVDLRTQQQLAAGAGRGVGGGAARGAAGERGRAVHAQRAAEAADAARAHARQAHRERVGDGGAVLPQLQDRQAPAHQHGQGRAQHDDAHLGGRLRARTAST